MATKHVSLNPLKVISCFAVSKLWNCLAFAVSFQQVPGEVKIMNIVPSGRPLGYF